MSNTTNSTGIQKVPFHPNSTYVEDFGTRAWCYGFFPPAVLVLTYLITCMVAGMCAMGVLYLRRWWNVPRRRDLQGKLQDNRLLEKRPGPAGAGVVWGNGRQWRLAVFSAVYCLMSIAVVITGLAYLLEPSICIHVFVFIAYYGLCGATLLVLGIILGRRWWADRQRRLAELDRIRRAVAAEYSRVTHDYFETPRPTRQVFW